MSTDHLVLVAGQWRPARNPCGSFQAVNPATGEPLPEQYPISSRDDLLEAVGAAREAARSLRAMPAERIARFLERYAALIETQRDRLVAVAQRETGLPEKPRLNSVELPRTTNQLRQAARAARQRTWMNPVIDTEHNIRSIFAPLGGAVVVFGPNNFPFAFNGIAGGDFAAAIATHNPVIAKAHPSHPGTTRALANLAFQALQECDLPLSAVQLIYHMPQDLGLELVAHPLVGATSFTGSRTAGLNLKAAADRAGKPIYLELSSINPVFVLPGALEERLEAVADEFYTSCTLGTGQFCTNPGLVIVPAGPLGETFLREAAKRFGARQQGLLFSEDGLRGLEAAIQTLTAHGAVIAAGGVASEAPGYGFANTLLHVSGDRFLQDPKALQTEAFGPVGLLVLAGGDEQMLAIARQIEGSLTGTIYSHLDGKDDRLYSRLEPVLRQRVGRLINDRMPTGVAVSPAMNHGGPFPATGHAGFTAVGIPASLRRFTALHSYDNVRPDRLPPELRDHNPSKTLWRMIDDEWVRGNDRLASVPL